MANGTAVGARRNLNLRIYTLNAMPGYLVAALKDLAYRF
jgi:hypothetical protein